jgi:hypothetical protein
MKLPKPDFGSCTTGKKRKEKKRNEKVQLKGLGLTHPHVPSPAHFTKSQFGT